VCVATSIDAITPECSDVSDARAGLARVAPTSTSAARSGKRVMVISSLLAPVYQARMKAR
jgi:hypothetical protein